MVDDRPWPTHATGVAPTNEGGFYIQIGCGRSAPVDWINFDASPRLWVERVYGVRQVLKGTVGLAFPANARSGDIVRGLPVPDASAQGVYCSHVLEHLPRDDVPTALRNTVRMLRPGGVFRLVVPDLQWRAARYINSAELRDPAAADALIDSCLLGTRTKPRNLMSRIKREFGKSAHLWMYDFAALEDILEQAGFAGVRRCAIGDSADPMFVLVEDADRFIEGGEPELAIEAVKSA